MRRECVNRKPQAAFSLVELLAVLVISAFLLVVTLQQIIRRNDRLIASGIVARQIAEFSNAVRQRISYGDALTRFNQARQTRIGIDWLQDANCVGGLASVQFLPCHFSPRIAQAGQLIYTTEITNTSGRLSVLITLADAQGKGYQAHGGLRPDLAGAAVMGAAGYRASSVTPVGLVTFAKFLSDPNSAIISVIIDSNTALEPWLRTDGSNPMNAELSFSGSGFNVLNAGDVEASSLTDKEDSNYWIDPSATSQVSSLNAIRVNADSVRSDTIIGNNAAFATARISRLEAGSVDSQTVLADRIATDVLIDKKNSNYFIDPSGMSRLQDIAIGARGDVPLSALLPRMVLMSSYWVANDEVVAKPLCARTGLAKIILVAANSENFLRSPGLDHGQTHTKSAAKISISTYRAIDNGNDWIVNLLSYNYETGQYEVSAINFPRALAQVYCQY